MRSAKFGLPAITLMVVMCISVSASYGAGASSNYGRTVCYYLKQRAMAAKDQKRRVELTEQYRRCLKEEAKVDGVWFENSTTENC